ncbi:MAG TPA: PAS domain S-box protein [Ideonella sp.]|nr:PAS domain S-box protein [Ideonella sp.]
MDALSSLLGRSGYLPHGYCFSWTPGLLWSMVGADLLIAASYFSIPLAIVTLLRRRKDTPAPWVAGLFSAFIFACGLTHVMDIWTVWQPDYAMQALTKGVTAALSVFTAVALWPLIPKACRIPSIGELQAAIASLEEEVGKRRSAEQHAEGVEQSLALALASIGAGFIATDAQARVLRMNAVAEQLTGWSEAEARGADLWSVFVREDRPAAGSPPNAIDLMIRDGATVESAHRVVTIARDGRRTPLELKAALTRSADGAVRGLAMIFRDMTRLVEAEAESSRLAAIVASSHDAIIGKTLDGTITSWNSGAERLFGYTAGEVLGQPMQMLIPADRADEEPQILAQLAGGGHVDHFETVRRRKDGSLVDISATISPLRDAAGRVVGASKIARDITERKRGELHLLAQLQRLRLLDQITRAIGERLDLRSVYQVAARSLEDELPAELCCVLSHEAGAAELHVASLGGGREQRVLADLERVALDGNGLSRCLRGELVYEADTAAIPFPFAQRFAAAGLHSLVVAPLQSESRIFGVLLTARRQPGAFSSGECEFIRQLSAHVALAAHQAQLYGALQDAFDELRQTQHAAMQQERLGALGQMASGIAHDINNALSPAVLYAESLLEREALSERAHDHVRSIARAIDDVAATVARMREFYRLREPQMHLLPVALNELVRQVVDLSRARWSDMPLRLGVVIEVETELAPELPPVWGVESELREALVNLVFNAVDAMPDGGRLMLRTRIIEAPPGAPGAPGERRVAVEVADTGIGMSEATRQRCLEPFFTTKGERGTGLGLAMVYGTAQRHGAEIGIASALGAGTTVTLVLPVKPQPAVEPSVPASRLDEPLRILLVDDDPVLLRSLRDALEGDGHTAQTAPGGQAGIDAFVAARQAGAPYQVVITDLGMPHVDGRQVAAAIRRQSPGTPVILLTGWGQRMAEDGDMPEGVDLVLSKPPRLNALREALAQCRTREARQ